MPRDDSARLIDRPAATRLVRGSLRSSLTQTPRPRFASITASRLPQSPAPRMLIVRCMSSVPQRRFQAPHEMPGIGVAVVEGHRGGAYDVWFPPIRDNVLRAECLEHPSRIDILVENDE